MDRNTIERNFTYHPPKENQQERYQKIRAKARELAYLFLEEAPECKEKDIAFEYLEQAVMWINASIARSE